jgi:DNA-directed RNA polymerase subunit E'/Rpb7
MGESEFKGKFEDTYGVVNGTHISEVEHAMKSRFFVNLNRCLVALLTVVVSLTIAVTAISMGRAVVAVLMAIITLIFIWQVIVNGSVVEIKNEGVETRFLGCAGFLFPGIVSRKLVLLAQKFLTWVIRKKQVSCISIFLKNP